MTDQGPDMEAARAAATTSVKGIWCVPKYANPTGCTYTGETVAALAQLPEEAAANDFVVLWDNAYAVHDLYDEGDTLASVFDAANVQALPITLFSLPLHRKLRTPERVLPSSALPQRC